MLKVRILDNYRLSPSEPPFDEKIQRFLNDYKIKPKDIVNIQYVSHNHDLYCTIIWEDN